MHSRGSKCITLARSLFEDAFGAHTTKGSMVRASMRSNQNFKSVRQYSKLPVEAGKAALQAGANYMLAPSKGEKAEAQANAIVEGLLKNSTEKQYLETRYQYRSTPLNANEAEYYHKFAQRLQQLITTPYSSEPVGIRKHRPHIDQTLAQFFDKFPRTPKNYNKFIYSLADQGKVEEAMEALQDMKDTETPRSVEVYTTLAKTFITTKDPDGALKLIEDMKLDGVQPNVWTFDVLLESCIAAGQLDRAYELYKLIEQHDLKPNAEVFTSLIKGCAVLDSDHQRAWQTYEHMKVWHCQPDNVLLTLMIHICARTGEAEKAMLLFKEIEIMGHRPTEVSYASIIYALSRRPDYYKEVFNYLEKMKDEGFIPTIEVMTNVLNAAAKSGDIDTAELVFDEVMQMPGGAESQYPYALMINTYATACRHVKTGTDANQLIKKGEAMFQRLEKRGLQPKIETMNKMIQLYALNGRVNTALDFKNTFSKYDLVPDIKTYNLLVLMFAKTHRVERAFDMFHLMKAEKIEPDLNTYIGLVVACTKAQYVNSGMKVFKEMKLKGFDIPPKAKYLNDFKRNIVKFPWLVRELDELTGKGFQPLFEWNKPGKRRNLVFHRELTAEEKQKTGYYKK